MYTIRLSKRGNKLNVRHTSSNVSLKKRIQNLKLTHTGRAGIAGKDGKDGEKGEQGDRGVGLPAGGIAGQLVSKASNADYDYEYKFVNDIGDKNWVHAFTVTDSVLVTHNLNKYPTVAIMDSAGDEVVGAVDYINTNSLLVTFNYPFSGTITCN